MTDFKSPDGLWMKNIPGQGKTRAGRLWNNLTTRTSGGHKDACYDQTVNGFRNFQEFAEWCQSQQGYLNKDENGYYWQLDKDFLVSGNKIYSENNCVFLPSKVNSLLIDQVNKSGLPTGVTCSRNGERFVARCRDIEGVKRHVGTFDTPSAAHTAWRKYKTNVVRMVLGKYELPELVISILKSRWDI